MTPLQIRNSRAICEKMQQDRDAMHRCMRSMEASVEDHTGVKRMILRWAFKQLWPRWTNYSPQYEKAR